MLRWSCHAPTVLHSAPTLQGWDLAQRAVSIKGAKLCCTRLPLEYHCADAGGAWAQDIGVLVGRGDGCVAAGPGQ